MPSRTKSTAMAGPTFGSSSSTVTSMRDFFFMAFTSPSFSAADQAHCDAFDREALPRVDRDRREIGIFRHQQHFTPAPFQPFDRDFVAKSRDDDLARARLRGAVHRQEIAVGDPGIAHRR